MEGVQDRVTLPFDYLVLATGVEYSTPLRDATALSLEHRRDNLWRYRENLKGKKVLVVGGGANGVEVSSELHGMCDSLSLATRGPRLLPNYPAAASEAAEQYLTRVGVNLLLNTDGASIISDFDVVIDCSGYKVKADSGP